ncbi:hypothetical protein MAP00_001012 [Monascus purpureus]|nr:hypothetical protein MAP00_001012 [Monascus purpureus]
MVMAHNNVEETGRTPHWMGKNRTVGDKQFLDISSVRRDIIDSSVVLESSQVMSSELQIDKLFTKMVEIILESCNGCNEFENTGLAVAAVGDLEHDQTSSYIDGLPFSDMEDKRAQQICHYVRRTKEVLSTILWKTSASPMLAMPTRPSAL